MCEGAFLHRCEVSCKKLGYDVDCELEEEEEAACDGSEDFCVRMQEYDDSDCTMTMAGSMEMSFGAYLNTCSEDGETYTIVKCTEDPNIVEVTEYSDSNCEDELFSNLIANNMCYSKEEGDIGYFSFSWDNSACKKDEVCMDDPKGIAASVGESCIPDVVGKHGEMCEEFDADFEGHALYLWELCPKTCGKCDAPKPDVCMLCGEDEILLGDKIAGTDEVHGDYRCFDVQNYVVENPDIDCEMVKLGNSGKCCGKPMDCDQCVAAFEAKGGCEAWMAGEDPEELGLVPPGCMRCAEQARRRCGIEDEDFQLCRVGDKVRTNLQVGIDEEGDAYTCGDLVIYGMYIDEEARKMIKQYHREECCSHGKAAEKKMMKMMIKKKAKKKIYKNRLAKGWNITHKSEMPVSQTLLKKKMAHLKKWVYSDEEKNKPKMMRYFRQKAGHMVKQRRNKMSGM